MPEELKKKDIKDLLLQYLEEEINNKKTKVSKVIIIFLIERLCEKSTWVGLLSLIVIVSGHYFDPENFEHYVELAISLTIGTNILIKEKKDDK